MHTHAGMLDFPQSPFLSSNYYILKRSLMLFFPGMNRVSPQSHALSNIFLHMHTILSFAMEIIVPSFAPVKFMIGYNMATPSYCVLLPVHARVGLKLSYLQVMLSPSLNYIALTKQD